MDESQKNMYQSNINSGLPSSTNFDDAYIYEAHSNYLVPPTNKQRLLHTAAAKQRRRASRPKKRKISLERSRQPP